MGEDGFHNFHRKDWCAVIFNVLLVKLSCRMIVHEPLEAFLNLFSNDIYEEIILSTNLEGRRWASASSSRHWNDISKKELFAFIGLLILAGSEKANHVPIRELFLSRFKHPMYKACFSVNRFEQILCCLLFDDKRTRPARLETDRLAAFSYVWKLFINNCLKVYKPGESVTVDEQLVPFRGRCGFVQYMPQKPHKYGIKIFWSCDAENHFAHNAEIYSGRKPNQPPETGLALKIVHKLLEPFYGSGRNVTVDNFFTSIPLAEQLLLKDLTLVGTLKKNKPEVPPAFKLASRDIHSSLFGFSGLLTMASYIPKKGKNVLMLSSMHHSSEIDQNSAKRKPEIILYYNKSKGGVDAMDQKLGNYTCRRQTKRWPVVLLYNMLDVATLNGFIIFTDHNPTRFGNHLDVKRLFLSELAVQLTRPHMIER